MATPPQFYRASHGDPLRPYGGAAIRGAQIAKYNNTKQ